MAFSTSSSLDDPLEKIHADIQHWLTEVVIGLNLCPFASKPYKNKQIRTHILTNDNLADLLVDVEKEILLLARTDEKIIETTILVIPNQLENFYDYWDFIDLAEQRIEQNDWQGVFQIASFHPDYQFAGTQPDDAENLTNRAPYPILHLLRENLMERAIDHYPNPESIPENNIDKMNSLSAEDIKRLFPYLIKEQSC